MLLSLFNFFYFLLELGWRGGVGRAFKLKSPSPSPPRLRRPWLVQSVSETKPSIKVSFVSISDSKISEVEEYDLELEGSFGTSDEATDADYMDEAYADEPLADAQWLALCEEERKVE